MRIFKQAFESIQGKKGEEENRSGSKGSFYIDEQFMTPEFLYKQNVKETHQATQKKINLTKQFFLTMSTMEYKFNQSPIKQINIADQLVVMYQECVQYYDTISDPIKYYFLDKIKNLVSQSDKFTQREPRSHQSSDKKIDFHHKNLIQSQQPLSGEVSYFKDFDDFNDRIDKPTEYATPKNEDQFQQTENKKIVQQLQNLIEDCPNNKSTENIIMKHHDLTHITINQNNKQEESNLKKEFHNKQEESNLKKELNNKQDESNNQKKKSPKIDFRNENNETPIPKLLLKEPETTSQNVVESQLQNQQKSIQDRLLARQRSQKKKDI